MVIQLNLSLWGWELDTQGFKVPQVFLMQTAPGCVNRGL